MFQLAELAPARGRAAAAGVREVFTVELDDIAEVHLHPRDMRGAIVSLSVPQPAESWRWGGPGWEGARRETAVTGATVEAQDADGDAPALGDGARRAAGHPDRAGPGARAGWSRSRCAVRPVGSAWTRSRFSRPRGG